MKHNLTTNSTLREARQRRADEVVRLDQLRRREAKARLHMERGIAAINRRYGHAAR